MIQKQPPLLDERVTQLEQDVKFLKASLQPRREDNELGWLAAFIGRFENDPLFAEASELGREWRKEQTDEASE